VIERRLIPTALVCDPDVQRRFHFDVNGKHPESPRRVRPTVARQEIVHGMLAKTQCPD
jgi:hypothetical protein